MEETLLLILYCLVAVLISIIVHSFFSSLKAPDPPKPVGCDKNRDLQTVLYGNIYEAEKLLKNGFRPKPTLTGNSIFIHIISHFSDLNRVEIFLKNGENPNQYDKSESMFALLWYTKHDDEKGIDLLLAYGADPNQKTKGGKFALSEACWKRNERLAKALLEPKHVLKTIQYLCFIREYCDSECLLHQDYLPFDMFKEITNGMNSVSGANPNQTFRKNRDDLPLKIAAQRHNYRIVELLLKHRADPNITTRDKNALQEETPLQTAIRYSESAVSKFHYERTIELLEKAMKNKHV